MLACPTCGSVYGRAQEYCGLDGSRLEHVDIDPLIGREIGRYHIESTLGSGGMARVYRACHPVLDRVAAIKVLHGELSADHQLSKRFEREARSLSRIAHPNVVGVLDFGRAESGILYMIMEYVEGQTLGERLKEDGSIPPLEAARITKQLAMGLGAAHECGYIHRDLKPQNVLLDSQTDPPTVKILDFGLVGLIEGEETDEPLTRQGTFFGTPSYMSPEQSAGERVGPPSDMYALGVVLYEMLTGSPPFRGDVRSLAQQHIQSAPPRPALEYGGLSNLALELLHKDPSDRPTPTVVLARLESVDPSRAESDASRAAATIPSAPAPALLASPDSALSVPIDRDEFSHSANSMLFEREALAATRSSKSLTALFIVCCIAAGGYGLYKWDTRPPPVVVKAAPPPIPIDETELAALTGTEDKTAVRAPPPKPRVNRRRTAVRRNRPAPDRPKPQVEPAKPVAMVVYSAFKVYDDDLSKRLSRQNVSWRELELAEPRAADQWSAWSRAKDDVPRGELADIKQRLEEAGDRIADARASTVEAKLEQVRTAFRSLPSSFSVTRKASLRNRLRSLESRAKEARSESDRRTLIRGIDTLLRELARVSG